MSVRVSKKLNKELLKIGFIGAGSIGSLFGGYIASIHSDENPLEVTFFCRKDHRNAINKNGLELITGNKKILVTNIQAYETLEEFVNAKDIHKNYRFDFLFLTTKSYDSIRALIQYREIVDLCNWLVILQNGVGNEDLIKEICDENKILRIITSHGALIENPGVVSHTGVGFTKIGVAFRKPQSKNKESQRFANEKLDELKALLDKGGIKTDIVEDIIRCSWEKVFVNIGINALGALTRLKNGELLENEYLKQFMARTVKEGLEVAKLKGINLSERDYIDLTYTVAEQTHDNKNSMLQDILKRKPTEIDFLNGKILEYAKELGIKVPINELLTFLIKGLERSFE
ncbi:MAG: ketopantoate reductase family protein [Candidatus Hermodarchaeota archaeon]